MIWFWKEGMDWIKEWIDIQKKLKGFYWMAGLLLFVTAALTGEYLYLGYGCLKIFRYLALVWGLFLIAWIDCHEKRVPNRILLVLFCIRSVLLLAECILYGELWTVFIVSCFIGFTASGGMFLLCYFMTRGALGAGDVKLMAVLGYFIGSKFIFGTIFLIVVIAAGVNIVRLLFKKVSLKQEISFAPFVLAGTLLMLGLGI